MEPYARIESELAGTAFSRIRYVEATASTNADASALLGDEGSAGLTIVAEYQSGGAGRKGRSWLAEPGSSLLFTTVIPGSLPAHDLWIVPFWTALAIRRALGDLRRRRRSPLAERPLARRCQTRRHSVRVAQRGRSRVGGLRRWNQREARRRCGCDRTAAPRFATIARPSSAPICFARSCSSSTQRARCSRTRSASRVSGNRKPVCRGAVIDCSKTAKRAPFEATAIALATGGGLVVARDEGSARNDFPCGRASAPFDHR